MSKQEKKCDVALSTLYFGLNYGSILTAFGLYKAVESYGMKPALLSKPNKLWTDHYANPESIANLFINKFCNVLTCDDDNMADLNELADQFLVGSDVIWSYNVVGKDTDDLYFLPYVRPEKKKIAYAPCFGGSFQPKDGTLNQYVKLMRRFSGIAVKEDKEAEILRNSFGIEPAMVIDPVFLCDKQCYVDCAEQAAAKHVESDDTFIFSSIENCDSRKRAFLLRGNEILVKNHCSELRNFIDINRYPESKALLDLDVAYHNRVEDYLYYLMHSEFVITDNYYTMCMALIFEKPFVVLVNEDFPEIYRFESILKPLGLEERLVVLQEDLKKKEYLFRMPIRWNLVNEKLQELKSASEEWLKAQLGVKTEEASAETPAEAEVSAEAAAPVEAAPAEAPKEE
ncbi:MAG: polysaccharide pyruvyl transferase family protein [Ruminococcus sp.]|nr:polysaccharide pyruvyl transferase family protein [Oscillospiraceae bacterium]MBQ8686944.1 polysaccharide pyruvyl transferase family protein [Ruminococcus sp.]